jgi:hypothetical protein
MTEKQNITASAETAHPALVASLGGADMAISSSSAGIVAKFSTLAGGVWIEETPTPLGTTRAWRFAKGFGGTYFAEWACLDSLNSGDNRFYGSQYTDRDFILC